MGGGEARERLGEADRFGEGLGRERGKYSGNREREYLGNIERERGMGRVSHECEMLICVIRFQYCVGNILPQENQADRICSVL